MGSFTPMNLDKTQTIIIKIEINKYEISNDSKIKVLHLRFHLKGAKIYTHNLPLLFEGLLFHDLNRCFD